MKIKITYTRVIAIGFIALILLGALLLSLPVSSRSGEWTNAVDAFFTSASATCVTGLVVYDTYTYWSLFGQIVILCLIQIGGLGLMTFLSVILIFTKKKISLYERKLFVQASGALKMSGIHAQIRRIVFGTLIFEAAGTVALATQFCPEMGFWEGLYNALFHSVSAFCNAGFDLMGKKGEFSSFTSYSTNITVNVTIMLLIIIGGIGFIVWDDILTKRFKVSKYQLHTKIVLSATAFLLIGGWIMFFIFESNGQLSDKPLGERLLLSLFQSVTTRTAGFNTLDISRLTVPSVMVSVVLMMIGGSPGSTAGGMKTSTIAVLTLGVISLVRNKSGVAAFKRKLEDGAFRTASVIAIIYISLLAVSTTMISAIDMLPLDKTIFELASAMGTVGLSMGITTTLSAASRIIVALLMYTGRIGGLSLALMLAERREYIPLDRPVEKILLG